jgi:hypothetical protein
LFSQLHLEHGVGQRLDDRCHDFYRLFLRHPLRSDGLGGRPRQLAETEDDRALRLDRDVNSKCAEALPSRVRTVQPSRSPRLRRGRG